MYVIGITGYSGTGKSTIAKKISEKFDNTQYIEGDYWMHKIPEEFKDYMIELFGKEKIESVQHSNSRMLGLIFQDTKKGSLLFKRAMPWMEKQFLQALENAQNKGVEYAVCDWALLPALDIWNQSDMRIKVDTASSEIRYNKLFERSLGNNRTLIDKKTSKEKSNAFASYKNRDDFVDSIIGKPTNDFVFLENDFDLQSLEQKIDSLCKLITFQNNEERGVTEKIKLNKNNIGKIAREEDVLKEMENANEIYNNIQEKNSKINQNIK